jgi:hypothetical protein
VINIGRGQLNETAQAAAKKHLGREITLGELRLMPYVQYVMMNSQVIEPRHIGDGEREILAHWKKEGHIEGGASGLAITREFWDAINNILFETYVKR